MKKTKLLAPLFTIAGIGATIIPIATITSCSCNPSSEKGEEVTDAEWKDAFDTINFVKNHEVNYSATIVYSGGQLTNDTITYTGIVAGKKIYQKTQQEGSTATEEYFEWKDNVLFGNYTNGSHRYYSLDVNTPLEYIVGDSGVVIYRDYKSEFTLNSKGAYVNADASIEITFKNKKIIKCKVQDSTFEFKDYGTSTIQNYPTIETEDTWHTGIVDETTATCTASFNQYYREEIIEIPVDKIFADNNLSFTFTKEGTTALTRNDFNDTINCFIATDKEGVIFHSLDSAACTWNNNKLDLGETHFSRDTKKIYMSFQLVATDTTDVKVVFANQE